MSTSNNNPFKFQEFPKLQSARLHFTDISDVDAPDIFRLRYHKDVLKYIVRKPIRNVDDIMSFIDYVNEGYTKEEFIFWGIRLIPNQILIGTICLWHFADNKREAEVGYELHPSFWGRGYAQEALTTIIDFSFSVLKLKKLEAFTHKDNEKSRLLLERNKFVVNAMRKDEGNVNNLIYELQS